jgi:hypothetical protein
MNTALLAGAALSADGSAKASMGVDAGDFDNDGDDDLIMTELTGQGSNLFVNDGSAVFEEQSTRAGIHAPTLPLTGFGTAWIDIDKRRLAGSPLRQRVGLPRSRKSEGTISAAATHAGSPQCGRPF